MKRTVILAILVLFLAIAIVNATSLEQGRIISKDITTNHGIVSIEPTIITQTINAGEIINKEIKISLTADLTKEFDITLLGEGEIGSWINFEEKDLIINEGENSINFNISIPSNAQTKEYSGFIIMKSERVDYNLLNISLNVTGNSQSNNNGGSSSGGGGCITEWICTEWSDCINEKQTRTCEKEISYCYAGQKPNEEKTCYENELLNQKGGDKENNISGNEENKQNFVSGITGAVIGTLGTTGTTIVGIFLAGLISSAIVVRIIRKRKLRINKIKIKS